MLEPQCEFQHLLWFFPNSSGHSVSGSNYTRHRALPNTGIYSHVHKQHSGPPEKRCAGEIEFMNVEQRTLLAQRMLLSLSSGQQRMLGAHTKSTESALALAVTL